MLCTNCRRELPSDAQFCAYCGTKVTPRTGVNVKQNVGTVSGDVTGVIAKESALPTGLSVNTDQTVDTVAAGGTLTGAVFGGLGSTSVGGVHYHGDTIDARGSQGFVNQPGGPVNQHVGEQRTVNTGGDYAEGDIDKRSGSFVQGDQTTISGVSGSNINVGSTLTNVAQRIEQLPHGDAATRAELQRLIAELQATLEQAPPASRTNADEVARRAETVVAEIAKPAPDQEDVQYSLVRLQKAAQNLAAVLPAVLPIAMKIAEAVTKMIP